PSSCRKPPGPGTTRRSRAPEQPLDVFGRDGVDPSLRLVGAHPTPLAAFSGASRVRVADRVVAAVVQRVVWQPARADVLPAALVAPVGERAHLPELVLLVPTELGCFGPRRRLVAADAGDPGVELAERPHERCDLRDGEIEVGLRLPELVLDGW